MLDDQRVSISNMAEQLNITSLQLVALEAMYSQLALIHKLFCHPLAMEKFNCN